jgi:glycosyltransferase involved in cell wall biosynthesis
MNHPLVSIMMPAYNAEDFIAPAIESVLSQTYANWELIIVDDGSTDRTNEIAASFHDARLKLVHQANSGEAAARNTALRYMQGEWLAFLDADDQLLPNHLEATITELLQHPEYTAIYTDGIHIDQHGTRLQSLSSRRRGPFEGRIFEQVVRASDVFGPPLCILLRRSLVVEHQLQFDPRIIIGPDWDFFTRLSEHAFFGYLDQQTCLYRVHQTNVTVQTGSQKRAQSLAICREKALDLESFGRCSDDTRSYVFYDLLVNLLDGSPEDQARFLQHPQWNQLSHETRGRILRLMARDALLADQVDLSYPGAWLEQSRRAYPSDRRSQVWLTLFRVHPSLCRFFIRLRRGSDGPKNTFLPFEDLNLS